jgi:hypothetical protein
MAIINIVRVGAYTPLHRGKYPGSERVRRVDGLSLAASGMRFRETRSIPGSARRNGARRFLSVRFLDGLVKRRFSAGLVILAKARIQSFQGVLDAGSGPA